MDGEMDVVVGGRTNVQADEEGGGGGVSDTGSTVVHHSDTNESAPAVEKESKVVENVPVSGEKTEGSGSISKSRKKKERRKKERKSGEKRSKTETIKTLEEENSRLKNELNDLNLRLVHLEARDHNKELKILHLQKELEETRSLLIEKEGDCVEWEQIDREKDKTVVSLNQTIAILQRDLTLLLDEKEKSGEKLKKKKSDNRIVFSPKPEEVFEYPREDDYDSDEGDMTSSYDEDIDEEEEPEDKEEYPEVIEKPDPEESEPPQFLSEPPQFQTAPPAQSFFPFPAFSALNTHQGHHEPTSPSPQSPQDNPLVKIFSPTMAPNSPFGYDSPVPSPQSPHHHTYSPTDSPTPSPSQSPAQPSKPNGTQSHQANGASPSASPSPSPSSSTLNLKIDQDTNDTNDTQNYSPVSSPTSTRSPTSTHTHATKEKDEEGKSGDNTLTTQVSVKELRNLWEHPKSTPGILRASNK